jgi:hypothetical protein
MKQREYIEGQKALANFKEFTTAILQVPVEKKKKQAKPASSRKPKRSDKD